MTVLYIILAWSCVQAHCWIDAHGPISGLKLCLEQQAAIAALHPVRRAECVKMEDFLAY